MRSPPSVQLAPVLTMILKRKKEEAQPRLGGLCRGQAQGSSLRGSLRTEEGPRQVPLAARDRLSPRLVALRGQAILGLLPGPCCTEAGGSQPARVRRPDARGLSSLGCQPPCPWTIRSGARKSKPRAQPTLVSELPGSSLSPTARPGFCPGSSQH